MKHSLLTASLLRVPVPHSVFPPTARIREWVATFVLALTVVVSVSMPARAAWWESVQPQARVWLKQVDPQADRRKSDAQRPWVTAEVTGTDVADGSITFHHGPINRVGMPEMTMTLPFRDPAHLRMLKPGSRIEIQAAEVDGFVKIVNIKMRH